MSLTVLGFDTETYQGRVRLLECSSGEFIETSDTDQLLGFLYQTSRAAGADYCVFWNLGFDVGAILKPFVEANLEKLRKGHYRKIRVEKRLNVLRALSVTGQLPQGSRSEMKELLVELDGMETVDRFDTEHYHVTLVGAKGFGIRPQGSKHRGARWFFDAAVFYTEGHGGMKLDTAARRYLGEGRRKLDQELGVDRAAIGSKWGYYDWRRDDIVRYCREDAQLTADLLLRTIEAFQKLGFPFPKKPFSKGSVAKAILEEKGTLHETQRRYGALKMSAFFGTVRKSYQGGVFLLRGAGHFTNTYAPDLNSAYPWALASFPSLEGAEEVGWKDPRFERCFFQFYRIRLKPTPRVPLREKASLRKIYGWSEKAITVCLTRPDLEAMDAWGDPYEVLDAVGYFCPSPTHPFAWLHGVFRQKSVIKHEFGKDSVEYLNVKIVANAGYGIIAQRRPRESKFTNLIYASYTTALCRRELWKAAFRTERAGDRILQYATDGLLIQDVTQGVERAVWQAEASEELGAWSVEDTGAVTLFETGVYVVHGKEERLKKRGAPDLTVDVLRACSGNAWESRRSAPIKLRTGIIQRKPQDIGVFLPVKRTLCPVQSFVDAGQRVPRSLLHAPLSSYFERSWMLELRGEGERKR